MKHYIIGFLVITQLFTTFSTSAQQSEDNQVNYKGILSKNDTTLVKKNNKWTLKYSLRGWQGYAVAINEFVEIKSDEQYFYIGEPIVSDDLSQTDKTIAKNDSANQVENDVKAGVFLPSSGEEGFKLYEEPDEEDNTHMIQREFFGYKNILRIPKKGGWVQNIGCKRKADQLSTQKSGMYILDCNQDEWWNDFQVKLSSNK